MGSAYGCKSLCSKISVMLVNAVLDVLFLSWSIDTGPSTCIYVNNKYISKWPKLQLIYLSGY